MRAHVSTNKGACLGLWTMHHHECQQRVQLPARLPAGTCPNALHANAMCVTCASSSSCAPQPAWLRTCRSLLNCHELSLFMRQGSLQEGEIIHTCTRGCASLHLCSGLGGHVPGGRIPLRSQLACQRPCFRPVACRQRGTAAPQPHLPVTTELNRCLVRLPFSLRYGTVQSVMYEAACV